MDDLEGIENKFNYSEAEEDLNADEWEAFQDYTEATYEKEVVGIVHELTNEEKWSDVEEPTSDDREFINGGSISESPWTEDECPSEPDASHKRKLTTTSKISRNKTKSKSRDKGKKDAKSRSHNRRRKEKRSERSNIRFHNNRKRIESNNDSAGSENTGETSDKSSSVIKQSSCVNDCDSGSEIDYSVHREKQHKSPRHRGVVKVNTKMIHVALPEDSDSDSNSNTEAHADFSMSDESESEWEASPHTSPTKAKGQRRISNTMDLTDENSSDCESEASDTPPPAKKAHKNGKSKVRKSSENSAKHSQRAAKRYSSPKKIKSSHSSEKPVAEKSKVKSSYKSTEALSHKKRKHEEVSKMKSKNKPSSNEQLSDSDSGSSATSVLILGSDSEEEPTPSSKTAKSKSKDKSESSSTSKSTKAGKDRKGKKPPKGKAKDYKATPMASTLDEMASTATSKIDYNKQLHTDTDSGAESAPKKCKVEECEEKSGKSTKSKHIADKNRKSVAAHKSSKSKVVAAAPDHEQAVHSDPTPPAPADNCTPAKPKSTKCKKSPSTSGPRVVALAQFEDNKTFGKGSVFYHVMETALDATPSTTSNKNMFSPTFFMVKTNDSDYDSWIEFIEVVNKSSNLAMRHVKRTFANMTTPVGIPHRCKMENITKRKTIPNVPVVMVLEGNCGLPDMTTDELQSKMTSFKECVCVVCLIRPAVSVSVPVIKYNNNITRVESNSIEDDMNWKITMSKINDVIANTVFDDDYPQSNVKVEHMDVLSSVSGLSKKEGNSSNEVLDGLVELINETEIDEGSVSD